MSKNNDKKYNLEQIRQAWGAGRHHTEDNRPLGIRQFDDHRLLDRHRGWFFGFVLVGPGGEEIVCVTGQTYSDAWQRVMEARIHEGLEVKDAPQGGYILGRAGMMTPRDPLP